MQDGAGAVVRVLGGEGDAVEHRPDAGADGGLWPSEPLGEASRGGSLDVDVGAVDVTLADGRHPSGRVPVRQLSRHGGSVE